MDLTREDGGWEKAYTFPAGTIKHIHGIVPDAYRQGVLILTGDHDNESGIWLARDNFREVRPLLVGKQVYRACFVAPMEDGILFVTDTPLEWNHIRFATPEDGQWTARDLCPIEGSCIQGVVCGDHILFSTTVEPDSRKEGMLHNSRGEGILDWYSHVYWGNQAEGFREIIRFKKDIWPMRLFQFGNISFWDPDIPGQMVLHPTAVRGVDGKALWISLPE